MWVDIYFDHDPLFRAFDTKDDRLMQVFKPTTDVSETDKEVKIVCNLPGMTKENVKIDVDEEHKSLTISGSVDKEKTMKNIIVWRDHMEPSPELSIYLPILIEMELRQIWNTVF